MRYLLDTQLIVWATTSPKRLSANARQIIEEWANELSFSAITIWEVAIKQALGRNDFQIDPAALREVLLEDGYSELAFTSAHAIEVKALPNLHRDPFDRALLAQAMRERLTLLTSDRQLGRYPGAMQV